MGRRQRSKWMGLFLVLLLVLGSMSTPFRQYMAFPSEMRLFSGNLKEIRLTMPVSATAVVSDPRIAAVNRSTSDRVQLHLSHPFTLVPKNIGQTELSLKLFGMVPFKKMQVKVLPNIRVIPGGQSIGVKLKSAGPLVVGHHLVQGTDKSPSESSDIRVGDYIVAMDGQPIHEIAEVGKVVTKAGLEGRSIRVLLKRGAKEKLVTLTPAWDRKEKVYRIGLYIRNSAAGVGTLTFYDPKQKVYGALGHVITDMDTGQPIRVGGGKIIHSSVTSIQKGETGEPGEKRAIFFQENNTLGNIQRNTPFGIFGSMSQEPDSGFTRQSVPVGLSEEVKEGPAQILTVVDGQKVESYDIQIAHLIHQKFPATKGMIIKVTDPRLLKRTGGIVQGMSGSPIIQNGKLVGAVTHVFVNDPTSGYGTYIEWMLQDAGVLQSTAFQKGRRFFVQNGNLRKGNRRKAGMADPVVEPLKSTEELESSERSASKRGRGRIWRRYVSSWRMITENLLNC
ncbi:SpoIVB peptidase [Marininema mesophilum]|uniref:SpoIVB peptidase n=1 Tax=Marininema mesophilum TaxID=1048340 RepID=UPI0015A52ED6|nr:SpoIVB peptidase [Marininema mesophilum]